MAQRMAKNCIGLDLGSSAVKVTQIKKTRSGFTLLNFGIEPVPARDHRRRRRSSTTPASSTRCVRSSIRMKIKQREVALAISGNALIIKKIFVPAMTDGRARRAGPLGGRAPHPLQQERRRDRLRGARRQERAGPDGAAPRGREEGGRRGLRRGRSRGGPHARGRGRRRRLRRAERLRVELRQAERRSSRSSTSAPRSPTSTSSPTVRPPSRATSPRAATPSPTTSSGRSASRRTRPRP